MKKIITIALTILLGIILQVIFVFADCKNTPNRVAVEFAKAYFKLDPSMSELICEDQKIVDDVDVVDQYINLAAKEAKNQGFNINFLKSKLYHIETHTRFIGDNEAQVELTGKRRVSINPVYTYVARIFCIGETHEVDETIKLVKEDGKWKVCGGLL
jgi:hypothetical protein